MALTLITITQDNLSWAVNENFKRIFAEMKHKVNQNKRKTLSKTMPLMMRKFVISPVSTDTELASKSTTTNGFLKRARNCRISDGPW